MRFFLFAIRRLAASVPTLLIVLAGLFMLLQFAPGDTVDALMAQMGGGDSAMMDQLRKYYGLDATATVQLVRYLTRLVQLDLGFSAIYGKPVIDVILERLPATLLLMASSLSFAFAGGLVLGVLAARRVNQWPDRVAVDIVWHLALPTATLGLIFLATYLRIMRASMLEVMTLDFVRTARAKGLAKAAVLRRHVLRNALLPMVTLVGLQAGTMLGGSVVVESVFALPGLGRLAYEAVVQRDLNTLLGIVFVSALLVICVNFLVDILYARLDPRIAN